MPLAITDSPSTQKRPGPFGPAIALLPENQKIETILVTEPTADALERLAESGFSQLPVVDIHGHVHGVFSWQSFGRRMSEIHSLGIDLATLPVHETDMEKPRFISPDTFIDTGADWKEVDYVLVGDTDQLLGILTLSDIYGRLNDFAEAFVLLYEIEHEIRDLFRDLYSPSDLAELMTDLSDASDEPESKATTALQQLLDAHASALSDPGIAKLINFAIGQMNRAARQRARSRAVRELEDFTFAQYGHVIFDTDHWPRFDPIFRQSREILQLDFARINDLRNIVFHFRRSIGPRDTDRLRRFRDKLRYDRSVSRQGEPGSLSADSERSGLESANRNARPR
jgi:CBS domain-containing protein